MILELKKIGNLLLLIFFVACDQTMVENESLTVDSVAEAYLKKRGYENFIKDNEYNSIVALTAQRETCVDLDCAKKDTVPSAREFCGQSRLCSQILLSDFVAYRRYYEKKGEFEVYITVLIDSVRLLPIGLYNENRRYPDEINSGEHNIRFFDYETTGGTSISLDQIKITSDSLKKNDDAEIEKMSRQFFNEMTLKDSVVYMNDMQYYFLMDHNSSIAMELALEDILYKKQKKMRFQIRKNENETLLLQNGFALSKAEYYCMSQNTFKKCEK